MSEYMTKKRTQSRGQVNSAPAAAEMTNGIPNSMLNDVFAGKRRASSEMMGHREELAPSIAAKMSQAFGMDLSAMQVYRSDAMAGSDMHGMASGNKVVLSRDVDLNTMEGQAILGHEISHIRAQSQGIGTGNSGLLQNAALEHQADAEGMMAARGMSISGESMGMSTGLGMAGVENLTPMSGGMSASAGAPMQAKKGETSVVDTSPRKEYNPAPAIASDRDRQISGPKAYEALGLKMSNKAIIQRGERETREDEDMLDVFQGNSYWSADQQKQIRKNEGKRNKGNIIFGRNVEAEKYGDDLTKLASDTEEAGDDYVEEILNEFVPGGPVINTLDDVPDDISIDEFINGIEKNNAFSNIDEEKFDMKFNIT